MPRNFDRIQATMDCIEKRLEKNLGPFCIILQQHSDTLAKGIENLLSDTEFSQESVREDQPEIQLTLRNGSWKVQQKGPFKRWQNMTMKITFNTDVEHGVDDTVVKRHKNNIPNPSLDTKLAEFDMQCGGIEKGSVVIRLQALSGKALNKLKSAKPIDIIAILKSILTSEDMKKLKESGLKSVDIKIVADTNLSAPKEAILDEGVRKEAIVKHFTQLSESLPNMRELIPAFLQDDQIRDSAKSLLKLLMHLKRDERNEKFLRFLLEEESDRVRVIFKRQLKQRRMIDILKILEDQEEGEMKGDLGTDEIKKNYSFLLQELDGLEFLPAFAEKGLLADEIIEKMTSSLHRRDRTKLFIDVVLQSGDKTIDMFFKELHKRHKESIYNVLWSTKYPSSGCPETLMVLKNAICQHYTKLIEEIEPRAYRDVFVERGIFEAKEYDDLINNSPRKIRAAAFLNRLLRVDSLLALQTFVWNLSRTGNEQLAARLEIGEDIYEEMANVDCCEKSSSQGMTILSVVFDASIVNGKTSECSVPDPEIDIEYPSAVEQDLFQLLHFESIPLLIPDGTIEQTMSQTIDISPISRATKQRVNILEDGTHNKTSESPRSPETVSAGSGDLLQCTTSLKTRLTSYAPWQISLNDQNAIYVPEFRDFKKASYFGEKTLQRSKSSEVIISNQQHYQEKTIYLNAPAGDAATNFDFPFSDIHDPLQLWDSESVPLYFPKGIADESISPDEKVKDWLRSTWKAETRNQTQSAKNTPSADRGCLLKYKMPLNEQLPVFASGRLDLDGGIPSYIRKFRESSKILDFKDISLPSSKSSIFISNERKNTGRQLRRRSFDSFSSQLRSSSSDTLVDRCTSPGSSAMQFV